MKESGFERFMLTIKALSYAYDVSVIFEHDHVRIVKKVAGGMISELVTPEDLKNQPAFEKKMQSLKEEIRL